MKCDMAGAAPWSAPCRPSRSSKLPVNVIGIAGLVENMTGPAAMKLGDVLRSPQRPHDRSPQHRRRGPAGPGRRAGRGRRPGRGEDRRSGHAHRRVRRGAGHRSGRRDDQRSALVRRGGGRGPRGRRAGLAVADVPGDLRRADQERSGRHQERRRRPLGRRDHGRQVSRAIRRQTRPGPTSTSPARRFATSQSPGATPAPAASSSARWWKSPGPGSPSPDAQVHSDLASPGWPTSPRSSGCPGFPNRATI